MARPPADTVQITFRVPSGWMKRADVLASKLSRPGIVATRTDALRAALAEGLNAFDRKGVL
jgi:hypothetical protein